MGDGQNGSRGTICVLGDAHLDVVVRLSGPVAEETDTRVRTSVGVGGQAANVAAWVAALGGRARLIAARGSDSAADLVAAELARRGVELAGPVLGRPDGRGGVAVGRRPVPLHADRPGNGPAARRRRDRSRLARGLRMAAPARL